VTGPSIIVCLQSSEDEIHEGLDLWHATVIKHESEHPTTDHVPWKNAHDLYEMLDSIKAGAVGWKTYKFCYTGSKPQTPPQWMEETYELNIRDVLLVIEQIIGTTEFDGQFQTTPYEEYDHEGNRVFSDLMSGGWAYREAVCLSLQMLSFIFMKSLGRDCQGHIHSWCHARASNSR